MRREQSGNALFIVLIAIVLFAGLTMVMANLEGSREFDTGYEDMRSGAAQLITFTTTLDSAVTKVMSFNGCTENDLDFYDDGYNFSNYQHATTNERCQIFHPKGGQMTYKEVGGSVLEDRSFSYRITGQQSVEGIGTTANELTFLAHVTPEGCAYLNDQLGVENLGDGSPPVDDDSQPFTNQVFNNGALAEGDYSGTAVIDHANLVGEPAGCFYDSDSDRYIFLQRSSCAIAIPK